MAYMEIKEFIDIGTGTVHEATSWQVAKDPDFEKIIDESLNDKINVKIWHTPLPKLPEDGEGFYSDEVALYGRAKIHIGQTESNWLPIGPVDQNYQEVLITEEGQPDIKTNSTAINMQ